MDRLTPFTAKVNTVTIAVARMKSQLILPGVTAAGLLVIGHCISTLIREPLDAQWLTLAGLTILTGAFTIRIPSVNARLSVSETFVFASVLLFGTCAGTITVALEILIIIVAGAKQKTTREPMRVLYNVSAAALSIWIASHLFFALAGTDSLANTDVPLGSLVFPLAVLATVYFALNSGLVALALATQSQRSAITIWRANFFPLAVNYLGGASVAALFVAYTKRIDYVAFGVILPLLVISYLTFKYSFSRIEQATAHVGEIKRLYLSTIEALATAIDAKDQVTHGHIRRVQQLALGLAHELGVKDEAQLQALEAAALLHDTGKLAIPEHILNKPGKLTHGEFARMKEHARLGAEILSSIEFPYPVVPIVRHHHENWDGSGYPDGLKGTDIPIGARILSVVDCFDALTSDRPYRPRMSDGDALAILLQRRGVMYDPLIVDTFTAKQAELLAAIPAAESPTSGSQRHTSSSDDLVAADELQHSGVLSSLEETTTRLIGKTGSDVAILFACDRDFDRLVSLVQRSRDGSLQGALSIPLGSGVSGWVAVNGLPLVNADATLDFRGNCPVPGLVRSICVPVMLGDTILGVLSLYTTDPRGFSDDDRALIEDHVNSPTLHATISGFISSLRTKKSRPATFSTIH